MRQAQRFVSEPRLRSSAGDATKLSAKTTEESGAGLKMYQVATRMSE